MRIILCGPGASGKDYFRDWLISKGLTFGVSTTTRQARPGEVDGKTYHFVTEETFMEKVNTGQMVEWCEFSGWFYGTDAKDFAEKNVFIMTPSGMAQIDKAALGNSVVVYFNAPREVRRERLEKRFAAHPTGDTPERRLSTDDRNFSDFRDYDIEITDPFYSPEAVYEQILGIREIDHATQC